MQEGDNLVKIKTIFLTLRSKLMSQSNYLLFIDDTPVSEDVKDYFAQFNIEVAQQNNLPH